MSAVVEALAVSSVSEILRVVWMEVAMASLAATIYFTVTGSLVAPSKKDASLRGRSDGPEEEACKVVNKPLGKGVDQEGSSHQMVMKALRQGNIWKAIDLLKELPRTADGHIPANVAPRLLMAAAKASDVEKVMVELCALTWKVEARSLEAVATEAAKNKNEIVCRRLHEMSRLMSIPKSPRTLEALAKMLASDAACLRALVEDAQAPLGMPFAKAVLEACAALKDVDLAAELFEKVADSDAPVLRGIVEKAAARACAPPEAPGEKEVAAHCKEIRTCAKNGDLETAVRIFQKHCKAGASKVLYNSIIDASVECGNLDKAIEYFNEAKSNGFADVVSYNTAMKGYLAQGQVALARSLFAELSDKGMVPTLASFHGFLNFHVNARDQEGAWKVVGEMRAAGALPTNVTCSILLKGDLDSPSDFEKVLAIVDTVQPIDEVLFHSLAEACTRTGQLHVLAKYQARLANQGSSTALTAQTYGSMIKGHGHARDVQRVRELWREMLSHGVQPTAITLGCMVEALVSNRCTAEAWKLVQEMQSGAGTRDLVNTVIYSTILKGFANAKETDKVMVLYEEMKANGIHPNNITFNTILNAFAGGGAMDRVPALLEDMKAAVPPAEPDMVTYSTIIKGFCNSGCLDRALEILNDMKTDGKFTPDEVMYNILLDGCAKEHRPNDALKLLDDMKTHGVAPSNYTLSMLVKLMGRCRRLNQAFSILENISREYGLKVNIQVYTCLIQACFNNRQAAKALAVHDQMVKEGLFPDEMTYSVLVKGCLQASLVNKAVEITRCAYGLAAPRFKGTPPGISARCRDELVASLGGALSSEARLLSAELAAAEGSRRPGKGSSKGGVGSPPWRHRQGQC